ncbi:MAG: M4 family metallopeptidase [Bacteroidia bacterium]|nr:M4 family metallopeptidase [Bacteroidia bacterium]
MKTNYLRSFITIILFSATTFAFGIGAIKDIPGAQVVVPGKISDVPAYIRLNESASVSVSEFPMWASKYFGLAPEYNFHLINNSSDDIDFVHYRYQQTFNGIPVEGTMFILHTKNGKIISMNGELFNSISLKKNPSVSEQSALNRALSNINASIYKWQIPEEENYIKERNKNNAATFFPKGELVYVSGDGKLNNENLRLAWKFDVFAHEPESRNYVFVDAITGEVLLKKERIHTTDTPGTAITAYSGTRTIITDSFSGGFRLQESGRGNGVRTFNMLNGTNFANAVDFTDADNTWNNVNAQLDQYATDAHWGAEMTYDYYWLVHNRNSIDDSGFQLDSYVHYSANYANASWDGLRMRYGDGNGTYDPFTALDITGHEITHGVTEYSSNLNYSYESGALNESFSDIFGTAIEFYARPTNANWLMGADIGVALRNMANPNATGDPDTYEGTNWYSGTADNGGVHTNSNVQNYWFYLLTQGGMGTNDISSAYNVTGIGMSDAAAIAYRTNAFYLTPTSQYADARFYSIQSAIDLFGACTQQVISTTNAWYAVGVGSAFVFGVNTIFTANLTASCSVPFTVSFSNASTNAGTYLWDFGDASNSTQTNPNHTYTNFGTYTVTLIADGGACGSDTLTQTAYITITDLSPVSNGATVCRYSPATLTATGSPVISWYANSTGGIPLATGNTFLTTPITTGTTYYVESSIPGPSGYVGPVNNSFGGGGYHNNTSIQYLTFTVLQPCTLKTAWVNSGAAGNRDFQLWDNSGNPLNTYTVNVPNGQSTITLNIPLGVGSFRVGGSQMNLYRNNSGPNYPYSLNGLVTITGSSAGVNYYYYLYNWEVEAAGCITNRNSVPVTVALENQSAFNFTNVNNTYTFTDNSTNATQWFWNFGDLSTSTLQNPVHTYITPSGSYTVMHIVSDGTCSDTSYQTINVINGIVELQGIISVIYPNPAGDEVRIKHSEVRIRAIQIYDVIGQIVFSKQNEMPNTEPETVLNISELSPGVYSIEVIAGNRKGTGRFIKQ